MYCYVEFRLHSLRRVVNPETAQDGALQDAALQQAALQPGAPVEKLIHLALPVRLIHMRNGVRGGPELACTYDIHPRRRKACSVCGM
jgi:hypothetical protein